MEGVPIRAADPVVGAEDAFATWLWPHWEAMSLLARRLAPQGSADDVLQDALLLAWRKRGQFDESRGTARTWLLTLVTDSARKSRRSMLRRLTTTTLDDDPAATPPSPRELDVERAIAQLSERQRTAIGLYYFLGLPVADVSAVMRCAEGTVKSTLSDARSRLRELLGEDYW